MANTQLQPFCLEPEILCQVIGGETIMTPSPTTHHQRISRKLEMILCKYVEEKNLGEIFNAPMDVILSEKEIYQPDILFISKSQAHITKEKIEGAPDLIIEILSPSTAYYDMKIKKQNYAKFGVKEYWILDPLEKSVEVFIAEAGAFKMILRVVEKGEARSELIAGFSVRLQDIF